jgi:hypothetical protein
MLPQHTVQSTTIDILREQLTPTLDKYTFLYITLESVNYLQIVYFFFIFFSFRIFGKPMYIEIIGLQEWIEKSWC